MGKRSFNHNSRKSILSLFVGVAILNAYLLWQGSLSMKSVARVSLRDAQTRLWHQLHYLIEDFTPQCPPPRLRNSAGLQRFNATTPTPVENFIMAPEDIIGPIQVTHYDYADEIRDISPENTYRADTKGIVSSAAGTHMPTFVISLRILRRTGSKLPVELFLADWTEYEPYICDIVLPPLNARCVVLSERLVNKHGVHVKLEDSQLKPFAILFSSFQDVIWMDPDCICLHDPTALLSSEPFTTAGLVTWPDFWSYTVSPWYYFISDQPDMPTSWRPSTTSGMFLISKKTHFKTLLLAAYYNYHSGYYHPLISQGGPGPGDKDTFIFAASALRERFYTVSEKVVDLGHPSAGNGGVSGTAALQADPFEDYELIRKDKLRMHDESVAKAPRGYWIHTNLNPADGLFGGLTNDKHSNPGRLWTSQDLLQRVGYDVERGIWEETKTVTCTLEHGFESWKTKTGLCDSVTKHWHAVFENP
ncbi:mannosyltransferase putative-domain-containing protein [Aspergillus avenaceus]|uniref:Mannosyltransferase putative-domain-containing protein n=1 Tax=Aspergillus avenaceus TaxID=36643 RepID=A0A5N6TEZ3_ASPAV|nr:mannosyltransferase putative-domain-containing protein [Aspergillus avenaceus]